MKIKELKTPMPKRIARLRRDKRGYPIPFFALIDDNGEPDFTTLGPNTLLAMEQGLCHICGEKLTWWKAFVGGPLSTAHAQFVDGPMHEECARYALAVCPFMARPRAQYRPRDPDDPDVLEFVDPNKPERHCLYITQRFNTYHRQGENMIIYNAGPAKRLEWFEPS